MPTYGRIIGRRTWGGERDEKGHRTYKIVHLVEAPTTNGPATILATPGLPAEGSFWQFDDDIDEWAFCYPTTKVSIHQEKEGDPNYYWLVENTYSTKPLDRCNDNPIEDPLLEPDRISGGFTRSTREESVDKDGNTVKSSSHELFRGPQVEFDHSKMTIRVSQNVADLGDEIFTDMIDTVNDDTFWDYGAREVKLDNVTWERKVHGTCDYYFVRNFEFSIDPDTFDREITDEGTKVLHGHWDSTALGEGDGCLIDIVAVESDGAISEVSLVASGSGYPESATIRLGVEQTDNPFSSGGFITVRTNSSGEVISIQEVGSGGSNYIVDTSGTVETSSKSNWILDDINGEPPDKDNPSHFQRYKDRKGENQRVLLDGGGCPLASINDKPVTVSFKYYPESNFLELGLPTDFVS